MLPTLNHEETIFKEFSYAFTFLCRRLNPDRYCGPVLKPKVLWIFKKKLNIHYVGMPAILRRKCLRKIFLPCQIQT